MHFKKLLSLLLASALALGMLAGCISTGGGFGKNPGGSESSSAHPGDGESSLKGKRVRVIIGSTSTGGDSYMIADIVTRYLAAEIGFTGKVDTMSNTQALDTISKAEGDGSTIMMFHDMAYLSVLFGAVSEEYALENLTVGPRIGYNPGGCFAASASVPYNSLGEAAQWLKDNPDEELHVNVEAGSFSHLCFVVWYMWAEDTFGQDVSSRIKAIVGGTTDEKKQRLWDGNADIIYADYSSCQKFTGEGVDPQLAMKIFDTCGKLEGMDVVSMAEDELLFNGEPFDFNKDFFMLFPKKMDEDILYELTEAMKKVCVDPEFQAEMSALGYGAVSPEETELQASRDYIDHKRDTSSAVVEAAPVLDTLT